MTQEHSSIVENVAESWPVALWSDFSVLIAVSGGADSVALFRIIRQIHHQHSARGQLTVAHVNHGLRGEESRRDARFVEELARQWNVRCLVESLPAEATQARGGTGLEGRLRERRYESLVQMAGRCGARYLLTGHTADDQAETVLFRILRGTGLDGLGGMPASRTIHDHLTLTRPMLGIRRQQIVEYLKFLGQAWREDESNITARFTRNRLRNEVLPVIDDCFSNDVVPSLVRLAANASEATQFLKRITEPVLDDCFSIEPGRVSIEVKGLMAQDPYLVRLALRRAWTVAGFPERDMTATKWIRISDQLRQLAGERLADDRWSQIDRLPGNIRWHIDGQRVTLYRDSQS